MKDLITDILAHLKENEEDRERFNNLQNVFVVDGYGYIMPKTEDFYEFDFDDWKDSSEDYEKIIFILHALSSPNGMPICGFLDGGWDYCTITKTKILYNHAKTLSQTFFNAITKGKSFEEAYNITNDKYNEIF